MKDAERLKNKADDYNNALKEYKDLIDYLSIIASTGIYETYFIGRQFNNITIGRLQENGFYVKFYQVSHEDKKQNNTLISWKEIM